MRDNSSNGKFQLNQGLFFAKKTWAIFIGLWFFSMSPILSSSWAGDDWPNSQTPYWLEWRYGAANFRNTLQEALYWNHAWMFGQGRFYLIHWIESRFTFVFFKSMLSYKVFQFLILCICGLLFVYLVRILSNSHLLAILTLASLSITVQIRRGFDPHLAFAGMVPSMLIKVFLASILIYRASQSLSKKSARNLALLSGIMYFLAMSTYEFSFFLFPLLLLSFQLGSERKLNKLPQKNFYAWMDQTILTTFDRNFRPVLFAWLGYGFLVFGILRNLAKDISGAYELGLSWQSMSVFFSQLFTGIPLVSFSSDSSSYEHMLSNLSKYLLLGVLVLLLIFFSLGKITNRAAHSTENVKVNTNVVRSMILISSLLISTPGLMMSFQPVWWQRASIQLSYLGVLITEFGTALLMGIFLSQCFKTRNRNTTNKSRVMK